MEICHIMTIYFIPVTVEKLNPISGPLLSFIQEVQGFLTAS